MQIWKKFSPDFRQMWGLEELKNYEMGGLGNDQEGMKIGS